MTPYFFIFNQKMSCISAQARAIAYSPAYQKISPPPWKLLLISEKSQVTCYGQTEFRQAWHNLSKTSFNDGFKRTYLAESNKAICALFDYSKTCRKLGLDTLSDKELAVILEKFFDLLKRVTRLYAYSRGDFTEIPHEDLARFVATNFGNDAERMIAVLLSSNAFDLIKSEERDFITVLLDGVTDKKLLQHSLNYPYLLWNCYDEKSGLQFLRNRATELEKLEKSNLQLRLEEIELQVVQTGKEQKLLLEMLPPEFSEKATFIRDLGIDRLEVKNAWTGAEYLFLPLFREIANRLDTPIGELMEAYTFEDMCRGLETGEKISSAQASDRRRAIVFESGENGATFSAGDEAISIAKKIVPEHFMQERATVFKGTPASAGIASGRARVIYTAGIEELERDARLFKKGEIMVIGMTQPSMVGIIAKAGAIVADEGGITSHAAVICREFHIPCVVGTHTCTKAIRTGDLIEVDGNTGAVRIIERMT